MNVDPEIDPELDPQVAARLRPLTEAPVPELWSPLQAEPTAPPAPVTHLAERQGDAGRWSARRLGLALVAAAAAVAVVAIGVQYVRSDGSGQRIETPAVETPTSGPVTVPTTTLTAPTQPPSSLNTPATFPVGLDIGPDRRSMSSIPFGAFAVIYEAGAVVVNPDGTVLGHYTGDVPSFIYTPANYGQFSRFDPSVPNDCDGGSFDASLLFCQGDWGPTVEVADPDGTRHLIASFPRPPQTVPSDAKVTGHFQYAFPSPSPERGAPLLLQMSAECETPVAVLVDRPSATANRPDGGTIRLIDGSSYWDDSWPTGESVALGWSADGAEAYVWRFNSECGTVLDRPGVYAYRLDGTSRLLIPTADDVIDVALIPPLKPGSGPPPSALPSAEPVAVEGVNTVWPEGEDFLSALVTDETGNWLATFNAPTHTAKVTAAYVVAVRGAGERQALKPTAVTYLDGGGAEIRFDLGAEPIEPATLTIRWYRDAKLVGFFQTVIQPGHFAAS
jgi:hypothetical protein